jgi:TolB protein
MVLVGCGQPTLFGIVFASNRDGYYDDVYRMTSDGQCVERLTDTPDESEMDVLVSPDGNSILFSRGAARVDREVFRLDVESGVIFRLTNGPTYDQAVAWSPDGDEVAFTSDREGAYNVLYLMNAGGSNERRVPLETDAHGVGRASWSPDGRSLVYETILPEHLESLTVTLFIADLSSMEVKRLTYAEQHGDCFHPDWSPDGEWIAMVCKKAAATGDLGEIYIVRPDGSEWRQVTTRPASLAPDLSPMDEWAFYVREPRWSPDGNEIVYSARIDSPWNIYIIAADGRNNRRLTDHDAVDWELSTYRLP